MPADTTSRSMDRLREEMERNRRAQDEESGDQRLRTDMTYVAQQLTGISVISTFIASIQVALLALANDMFTAGGNKGGEWRVCSLWYVALMYSLTTAVASGATAVLTFARANGRIERDAESRQRMVRARNRIARLVMGYGVCFSLSVVFLFSGLVLFIWVEQERTVIVMVGSMTGPLWLWVVWVVYREWEAVPTLLQSLFNQPSKKYASEKLEDSDSDIFYTPLSTPPDMSSSSSSDLFSSHSATTTSTTSLSSDRHRPKPDWAKDVRWLVPPDSVLSSHTSSVAGSLLDLVDVEYDFPPKKHRRRKSRPSTSDRMSALLEVEEGDDPHSAQSAPVQGTHTAHTLPPRPRTISAPRRSRPPSLLTAASSSSRTVVIPSPLPVSMGSASTTGYTSLTLPRAAYAPSKNPARVSSSVDITRSGLAQTTMSTISITRHAAAAASSSLRLVRLKSSDTPARLRSSLPSPLSFSSHSPPPNKVHSAQVLVYVWAVALDALDALLVDERAAKSDGFGHVPGRSFVGRAVECGWEVNSVSKGDWVCGITDVRKSGALSEFIVVDKRRLHRAPRPSPHLTIDQLALLPLAGVPAHRAVRTLTHIPAPHRRALVLHAHVGPGLLATQELLALGFRVTAQVPGAWGGQEEKRARAAGAGDVRCGKAEEVLGDVGAKGELFDGVIDTLGGKDVWDACRKVLRTSGQFTTLIGDSDTHIPSANAHFKSNMRSLRRAFNKRDVGYQWVSPAADVDAEGEDVRDSLAAVVRLAEEGVFAPWAGRVIPFERAPDAFGEEGALRVEGSAVVRIVD